MATYSAVEHEDGGYSSYCVWSDDVETLLAETNMVLFFRGDDTPDGGDIAAGGDWDHVRQIVGDLMEPLDMYPVRYRVVGFPTDEQLAVIGQVSPEEST